MRPTIARETKLRTVNFAGCLNITFWPHPISKDHDVVVGVDFISYSSGHQQNIVLCLISKRWRSNPLKKGDMVIFGASGIETSLYRKSG
jgi:hypothetical protein